jgi:hypothetical protein
MLVRIRAALPPYCPLNNSASLRNISSDLALRTIPAMAAKVTERLWKMSHVGDEELEIEQKNETDFVLSKTEQDGSKREFLLSETDVPQRKRAV